jgi:hypothetical protein
LEAVFKGQKELFEGLYIYDKRDWTKQNPVIRLDFGGLTYGNSGELTASLHKFLDDTAQEYQLSLSATLLPDKFNELIKKMHKSTGQQVVVLIDEYDKPIIDHLANAEIATANRDVLRNVYQVLKALDEHLEFVFLTGVTNFVKLYLIDSPDDITIERGYTTICGYTQEELEFHFDEYIEQLAASQQISKPEMLEYIRNWYNGYSWDGITTVYNPYSILSLFENGNFSNYWFETGTPEFLVKLLKEQDIRNILEPIVVNSITFSCFDIENPDLLSSLVQTGYLTVKSVEDVAIGQMENYSLGIPNKEVNDSLFANFISTCTDAGKEIKCKMKKLGEN